MTGYFAHESAVVDAGARIGEGSRIWHFSHIMPGAVIGRNCTIGQNVYIGAGVVIGNGVKIQNNVSVYSGVVVEDDAFLGPSCVFTNVINPRSHIERKEEFRQTLVRRGVSIGANATIICGIELGEYAFIGAGSVVTSSVPAYELVKGNPARSSGWMSAAGHRLEFDIDGHATCPDDGSRYRFEDGHVTRIS